MLMTKVTIPVMRKGMRTEVMVDTLNMDMMTRQITMTIMRSNTKLDIEMDTKRVILLVNLYIMMTMMKTNNYEKMTNVIIVAGF